MQTQQRCVGTVVRRAPFGEAHFVIDLITREHGRVAAVARGARASKKRFGGILDLFATLQVDLTYSRAAQLPTLVAADALRLRLKLRCDLSAMTRAAFFCGCARALLPPQQAAPRAAALLEGALDSLDEGGLSAAAAFLPAMLSEAGVLPPSTCAACGRSYPSAMLGLQASEGTFCCTRCNPRIKALRPRLLAWLPPRHAAHDLDEQTARDLEALTATLVSAHQGRPLPPPHYFG